MGWKRVRSKEKQSLEEEQSGSHFNIDSPSAVGLGSPTGSESTDGTSPGKELEILSKEVLCLSERDDGRRLAMKERVRRGEFTPITTHSG